MGDARGGSASQHLGAIGIKGGVHDVGVGIHQLRHAHAGAARQRGGAATDHQREFAARWVLPQVGERGGGGATEDLLELLGQLAAERDWAIGAERRDQVTEGGDDPVGRFEYQQRRVGVEMRGEQLLPGGAGSRQEAAEAEAVAGEARCNQGGHDRGRAGDGHDLVAGGEGVADEGKPGIGDAGGASIGDEGDVALGEPIDQTSSGGSGTRTRGS